MGRTEIPGADIALLVLAATGLRRSELLRLRWDDLDLERTCVSVKRGRVAVAYELRESRGKTPNSRRAIDLDVFKAWRDWQEAEEEAAGIESEGWMFTDTKGGPVQPHSISQTFERIATRAEVPRIRAPQSRSIRQNRVGEFGSREPGLHHRHLQHVLPGMQADAARTFEVGLVASASVRVCLIRLLITAVVVEKRPVREIACPVWRLPLLGI